jgi:hypothetical protein
MALNANDVRVAITGELYVAPLGTAAPTTASSALPPAFVGLGYISDDGLTETYDESLEDIMAWQGAAKVRKVTSESEATLQCLLIQTSKAAIELYHKGSVIETDGETGFMVKVKSPAPDLRSMVFDVIDGNVHNRIYIPRAEVTERGDMTYSSSDAIGFDITVTAYPVDLGGGVVGPLVKFSDDPAWGDGAS